MHACFFVPSGELAWLCLCAGSANSEEARKEAAALAALSEKMGGGMRLTLTEQETAARQSVVLPWEQRQNGAQSQACFANSLSHRDSGDCCQFGLWPCTLLVGYKHTHNLKEGMMAVAGLGCCTELGQCSKAFLEGVSDIHLGVGWLRNVWALHCGVFICMLKSVMYSRLEKTSRFWWHLQDDFNKEAAAGLGQIIYERDSETDPDSDEDPDDDLDF